MSKVLIALFPGALYCSAEPTAEPTQEELPCRAVTAGHSSPRIAPPAWKSSPSATCEGADNQSNSREIKNNRVLMAKNATTR